MIIPTLLALAVDALLHGPLPETLSDPGAERTRILPEARVLSAEADHQPGAPREKVETLGPDITAESFVVIDVASGKVLTARNPSMVRPVASLTKLLTAKTVSTGADPDEIVTVGPNALAAARAGADMDLVRGERLSARNLLAGTLIPSANDAAVALAEHIAGTESAFAERMNQVAQELGLTRTHVVNVTGLDNPRHFSSAYDMALLLKHVWNDPLLGVFLRAEGMDVSSVDGKFVHKLRTTNRLLGERTDILAGKTGFTDAAGQSLAVVAESDESRPVAAVILGSPDRFAEMDALLNWTFWAYEWPNDAP